MLLEVGLLLAPCPPHRLHPFPAHQSHGDAGSPKSGKIIILIMTMTVRQPEATAMGEHSLQIYNTSYINNSRSSAVLYCSRYLWLSLLAAALVSTSVEPSLGQARWSSRRLIYSVLTCLILGCDLYPTGIAFSVTKLKNSLSTPRSNKTIGDSSALDSNADNENDSIEWATSAYLYTSALFIVLLVISLVYSLRSAGRLALHIHYRNLTRKSEEAEASSTLSPPSVASNSDAEGQVEQNLAALGVQRPKESIFWQRLAYFCGPRGASSKNSTSAGGPSALPTYGHAVRQAVLKRSARQGGPPRDFYTIGDEEVELERIRRLGGAPPSKSLMRGVVSLCV